MEMSEEVMEAFINTTVEAKMGQYKVVAKIRDFEDGKFQCQIFWGAGYFRDRRIVHILPSQITNNLGQLDIVDHKQFLEIFPEYSV